MATQKDTQEQPTVVDRVDAERAFEPVELVKDGAPAVTAHSKAEFNTWVYNYGYSPKGKKGAK